MQFPLISRCGRIRRLISECRDPSTSKLDFPNLPGGPESFELVAKFCYGINFEITTSNVAQLYCISDYLEMTEEYGKGNLTSRSKSYLDDIVIKSLEMSVDVLHQCEALLPLCEELKIVGKCVDAISSKACVEQIASSFSRLEYSNSGRLHMNKQTKDCGDWWIEDLSVLRIDMYQRVIEAMKGRGIRPESIGASLVNYTENLLKKKIILWNTSDEKLIVETIASLLPEEKLVVPMSFMFGLLRSAVMLDCAHSCRLSLERRIGSQLDMATLDDLLIPSSQNLGDTIFDVDTVHRILVIFSQQDDSEEEGSVYDSDGLQPPSQTALVKVGKLVDSYLAEIAPDGHLTLARFIAIADALPSYARVTDDGLYRAIDIYLKAHQGLSDLEKRRLCKLIDFQKLSEEASAHAAQNDRLPLQAIVQVLYIEQLRLRDSLSCSNPDDDKNHKTMSSLSPRDNYASLRRENRELKLELARMRVRLNDLEKGHAFMKRDLEKSGSQKLINSISRKFGRFSLFGRSPFTRSNSPTQGEDGRS
ncbi:BTB/POZ domain-containing protein At5g48800 isoform X2 [Asparagus officinalis]|uniref:BTB/POZ domain-containing protein At5g48800 isoform X2 n=1 Tax=Asparagus officinalis TaxID=4686 RepID=UPI00098E4EEB|nr:BTB/POZ domain-containing protein At5g48800 isoform X2 [Asparagus officinalis]